MNEVKKMFVSLNEINVNEHTEKRDKFTYLSWPYAWAEVVKRYEDTYYDVRMFNNLPYTYDPATGYMVFTDVVIEGMKRSMWLPVMNGANKPLKAEPYTYTATEWKDGKKVQVTRTVEAATMFDINKTIMRCLVKNLAMFGLGLYIYAGEDLPDTDNTEAPKPVVKTDIKPAPTKAVAKPAAKPAPEKPKDEAQKTAPTATANTSAPIKPVAAAANAKVEPATTDKPELTEDHPNYLKVIAYTKANAKFGIDQIAKALGGKYTITDEIKEKLNAVIKAANEPENN